MRFDAMKSLSERIAERTRDKAAVAPHSNRAVMLALRSDIQAALSDGWSILVIYQTLHDEGHVTFSYQAFRRYVNRLLLDKDEGNSRKMSSRRKTKISLAADPIPSFTFNPLADTKDLF